MTVLFQGLKRFFGAKIRLSSLAGPRNFHKRYWLHRRDREARQRDTQQTRCFMGSFVSLHFISIDFNRQQEKEVIFSLPKAFAEVYESEFEMMCFAPLKWGGRGAQINYIMSVRAMVARSMLLYSVFGSKVRAAVGDGCVCARACTYICLSLVVFRSVISIFAFVLKL